MTEWGVIHRRDKRADSDINSKVGGRPSSERYRPAADRFEGVRSTLRGTCRGSGGHPG